MNVLYSENNDVAATKHFGWIPSLILESANTVPGFRYELFKNSPKIDQKRFGYIEM